MSIFTKEEKDVIIDALVTLRLNPPVASHYDYVETKKDKALYLDNEGGCSCPSCDFAIVIENAMQKVLDNSPG